MEQLLAIPLRGLNAVLSGAIATLDRVIPQREPAELVRMHKELQRETELLKHNLRIKREEKR